MMKATRREKRQKKRVMELDIPKYFSHIQFHGVKRLAVGESRWYWFPSMVVLFVCASALIYLTVKRFQDNPTFMIRKERHGSMMKFPSVIICPEIDFQDDKVEEFLGTVTYPDDLNESYIRNVIPQLATFYAPDVIFKVYDLINLEKLLKYNNMDVETITKQLTRTCEDTLIRCRWNNKYYNCSDIFEMELTGDGFCCVFNGKSLRREMREGKEDFNIFDKQNKWFTKSVGFRSGLILAINQSQIPVNVDLSYKWVALQAAQRYVDTSLNGTALNPGSEQWMIYQIRSFYISDDAKSLIPSLRKCNLPDQALKYFPDYKRKYCIVECEIANTIKLCNCVRMVHPKPLGVRYCEAKDHECTTHAMVAYGYSCECMSTCNVDSSVVTTTSFSLDSSVIPIDRFYENLDYDKVTIVRVFIQTRVQSIFQRSSYFSYLELFAQLGGMFNVFFGISILTILGIVQFVWVTITVCIRRRYSDKCHTKNI